MKENYRKTVINRLKDNQTHLKRHLGRIEELLTKLILKSDLTEFTIKLSLNDTRIQ